MKKFLTSLLLLLTLNSFGQSKLSEYSTSYTGQTYGSYIGIEDSVYHTLFVDMFSLDNWTERGGLVLDYYDHILFTRLVADAKTKYEGWVKTAKQNGVISFEKQMDTEISVKAFFGGGETWFFSFNVKLNFYYKVIDGNHLLVIKTGPLVDHENEFAKHNGFAFVFASSAEIDSFLNSISFKTVNKFRKQQNLFKD